MARIYVPYASDRTGDLSTVRFSTSFKLRPSSCESCGPTCCEEYHQFVLSVSLITYNKNLPNFLFLSSLGCVCVGRLCIEFLSRWLKTGHLFAFQSPVIFLFCIDYNTPKT